jgi:segregation and condensation protein B
MMDQHPENGARQLNQQRLDDGVNYSNRQGLNGETAAQESAPEQSGPPPEETSGSPDQTASGSSEQAGLSSEQARASADHAASSSSDRAPDAPVDSDRKIVEAILFLADDPIPPRQIGEVLERPRTAVEAVLRDLAAEYERDDRGFVLRETAGGWRLYTNPDCHPWLERFVKGHTPARLTGAALEVLAIIAYRGPLSRAQIAEIRGVDSDGVVRTLSARRLIEEIGRDSGPGTPVLFGVSRDFLEGMGLRSLDDLPPLKDFMPDAEAVEEMEARLSPNV